MSTKSAVTVLVSSLLLAAPAVAQSAAALKRELRKRESAAKKEKTAEAMLAVAEWAAEKGMAGDAKRLFTAVLKKDPDNEAANYGLGNEKFDGKWMPKRKADALRKKAQAAEYKAKGYVEVEDVWVPKDQVADAKNGVFHFEDRKVTRDEKVALDEGKVYHPVTGLLIEKADLKKAESGQFPIGREGRWASEEQANSYYSDIEHPWVVRTEHATILATLELEKIKALKEEIDRACKRISPLLGNDMPLPTHRPTVLVAATDDEYREFGNQFGDETSAAAAFLMAEEAGMRVPFQGTVRGAICVGKQAAMTPYYARHAVAMALTHARGLESGGNVPSWFLNGVGSLAGFFDDDHVGAHFCRTMVAVKGGVPDLRPWFNDFAISGEMDPNDINFNWTVAGLLMHFAMKGDHEPATKALMKVTAAFEKGSGVEAAIKGLQKALEKSEDEIKLHMQVLVDTNR
ncbi:MAG: hypothetical protein NXI31_05355 [bacterium]|nr:hypothetical protein [bacterium]